MSVFQERWHMAKVLVIRQGQGAIMQLAGGKHKVDLGLPRSGGAAPSCSFFLLFFLDIPSW